MDKRVHGKVDMEVWRTRGSILHRSTRSGDGIHASIVITLLIGKPAGLLYIVIYVLFSLSVPPPPGCYVLYLTLLVGARAVARTL